MTTFDQMVRSAAMEPTPQRLLFVFATVDLPPEATPEQKEAFAKGRGGMPVPLMCVDKAPQDIVSFAALSNEAQAFGKPWALLFAASMAGSPEEVPTSGDADKPLEKMVEAIRMGNFSECIVFDTQGEPLNLS